MSKEHDGTLAMTYGMAAAYSAQSDGTPQMPPVAVAVDQTHHLLVSSRITA